MGEIHKKPLNIPLFLASQILLIIVTTPAFIPKPAQLIAFAVVGWYSYQVILTETTGDFNVDFGIGSTILSQYLVNLDYALLTPPDKSKDFHDNNPTSITKRPLKERILWAFQLFSNPRGIGWAHEPSHLPPRPSPSTPRSRFVFSRLCLSTCYFLGTAGIKRLDAAYLYAITAAGKLLTDAPLHLRVLGVLSFGLGGVCVLCGINAFLSALVISCGLSSPERWPLFFGSPLELWSIRRFWRRFWHQGVRRSVLTCSSSILGCVFPANSEGATGCKLARLYTVFFITGVTHIGGDVMSTGKLGFKTFTFFMLQPVGITIEIVVSYLWHKLQCDDPNPRRATVNRRTEKIDRAQEKSSSGNIPNADGKPFAEDPIPALWIRCVGSIWLALWMMWTAAYMVDGLYAARLAYHGQI